MFASQVVEQRALLVARADAILALQKKNATLEQELEHEHKAHTETREWLKNAKDDNKLHEDALRRWAQNEQKDKETARAELGKLREELQEAKALLGANTLRLATAQSALKRKLSAVLILDD